MFCSQCGTKNDDGAKFCSSCGTPVAAAAATPPQNKIPTSGSPTVASSSKSIVPIAVGVVLVLGLLGGGGAWMWNSKQKAPTPVASTATSTAEAVTPTTRVKLSTEESYIKLREELLKSEWTAWTQPPVNNWKAPFSEVMVCHEGICIAYFSKRSDQSNLREISYGVCGWYEEYYDSAEDKKKCLGRKDFLVVLSDTLISTKEGLDFYKSVKARFES